MELSERFIQKLEQEGFADVYEWRDAPGTVYSTHVHPYMSAIYVTDGSMTVMMNGVSRELSAGERFDIPAETEHSVTVGPEGAIYIVGER